MADTANITANISDTASITGNSVSSATITSSVTTSTSVTGSVTTGGVGADGADATGDVVGPASSTDTAIARFDATTGKLLKNSSTTIADNGYIYSPGSLETAGAIIADTIAEHTGAAGVTIDGLLIKDGTIPSQTFSYCLQGGVASSTIADGLTYYIGSIIGNSPSVTEGNSKLFIPRAGTIKKIYVHFYNATTNASTETSSLYLRLNSTTDTTLSTTWTNDASISLLKRTDLSIAVAADDWVELKWVTPTWVTNPAGCRVAFTIYIEC